MGVYIDETMSTDDIYILPASSESSILIPSSATAVSSSSSTMESSLHSSDRICYLLKNEKQQYGIIKN